MGARAKREKETASETASIYGKMGIREYDK
jgi:hypothetical protein